MDGGLREGKGVLEGRQERLLLLLCPEPLPRHLHTIKVTSGAVNPKWLKQP